MQIPLLYLISSKADLGTVQDYLAITPVALVVATDYAALALARMLSQRVLLDQQSGQIAKYLKIATETYDCPIAIVGDFEELIVPLGEQC